MQYAYIGRNLSDSSGNITGPLFAVPYDMLCVGENFTSIDSNLISLLQCKNLVLGSLSSYCNNEISSHINESGRSYITDMYTTSQLEFSEWIDPDFPKSWPSRINAIENITFDSSFDQIPEKAFIYAQNINSISFTDKCRLTRIGAMAFYNIKGVSSLKIPGSVIEIGKSAFFNTPALKTVTFMANANGEPLKLHCANFVNGEPVFDLISLNRSLELVKDGNFNVSPFYMKKVKKIQLGEGVAIIPEGLFKSAYCYDCFYPLSFPPTVTEVGADSFRSTFLTSLTLNKGLKKIGSYAFGDLEPTLLERVNCYSTVPPEMDKNGFMTPSLSVSESAQTYNNVPLHVPATTEDAYRSDPAWSQFREIIGDLYLKPYLSFTSTQEYVKIYPDKDPEPFTPVLVNESDAAPVFASSDPGVATIDSATGVVTPISEGTTVISASVEASGCFEKATCYMSLTITLADPVTPPEEIKLSVTPGSATLFPGEEMTLSAVISPADAVGDLGSLVWSSSDSAIATVNENGHVRGVSPGNADIVVSMGLLNAVCKITVVKKAEEESIEQIIDGVKYRCNPETGVAEVPGYAFTDGVDLGEVVIRSSVRYKDTDYPVTSIAFRAFYGCGSLTSMTIPNSVVSIGSEILFNCSSLKDLIIEDSPEPLSTGTYVIDMPIDYLYIGRNIADSNRPFFSHLNLGGGSRRLCF